MKRISPSVLVYLLLLVVIVVLHLLLMLFPAGQITSQMVKLTDTLSLVGIWLLGWIGVILAIRAGFPGMWQADIPHLKRFF